MLLVALSLALLTTLARIRAQAIRARVERWREPRQPWG